MQISVKDRNTLELRKCVHHHTDVIKLKERICHVWQQILFSWQNCDRNFLVWSFLADIFQQTFSGRKFLTENFRRKISCRKFLAEMFSLIIYSIMLLAEFRMCLIISGRNFQEEFSKIIQGRVYLAAIF